MNFDWKLFRFPFDDPRWKNKLLVGMVIGFLGPLTLGVLSLPVWGYGFQVMKRSTQTGQPYLPEWDDWGQLFKDGLRYWFVNFIYRLPAGICMVLLVILMYGLPFAGPLVAEALGTSVNDSTFPLYFFGGYLFMFPVMGLYMLFNLVGSFIGQVGGVRMAAEDSLSAAFAPGEIWRLFRRGAKQFLIAAFLWGMALYALQIAVSMLQATLIFICFMPFINALMRLYRILLAGSLFGNAYHQTQSTPASDPPLEEDAKDGKLRFRWVYLNYPFQDERWRQKLFTGALLSLFSILVVPLILVHGYMLHAMRSALRDADPTLPEWDYWGNLLRDGFRSWIIGLVYSSPGWIPHLCILILWAVLLPLTLGSGPDNPAIILTLTGGGWISFMILGIVSSILFPILIVASFLSMVAVTRYAATGELRSAFELREVWRFARRGFRYYLIAALIIGAVGAVFGFVYAFLMYTVILLCLLPFISAFLTAYLAPVRGNLLGIAYRYTETYTLPTEANAENKNQASEDDQAAEPAEDEAP